jgi:hypothetical protein
MVDPLHGHQGRQTLRLLITDSGGHMKILVYETKVDKEQHCILIFLQRHSTYATILTALP